MNFSKEAKDELALALLLWKDFKIQGVTDENRSDFLVIYKNLRYFSRELGVELELQELIKKCIYPFKITMVK